MVMVFVRLFVLFVGSRNLSYVDEYHEITLRWGYRQYLVAHSRVHYIRHGDKQLWSLPWSMA
jgi:hypothetical protein